MMIFGLPAACLAMVLRARRNRRKAIAGMMISAALTSIITGITEPIEFAFTFVAPLLYVVHAGLAFVSGMLTSYFDIHLGYTFSASLIDLALGYFNQKNVSMLFFVVGPVMAILYFSCFYFLIGFFDFKTPGRELEIDSNESEESPPSTTPVLSEKAANVLAALGGKENISTLDACITRLRLTLKDSQLLDEPALKMLGASGVMKAGGGNTQIVFGVESDFLKMEIQKLMLQDPRNILSPLQGYFKPLNEIPDETFKSEMMGPTVAIQPIPNASGLNQVTAPFAGTIATMFRTGHAVGLVSDSGVEVLIHIGIDTVKMNGEGFFPKVKDGDRVRAGQVLIEYDLKKVESQAKSSITPIVITNSDAFDLQRQELKLGSKIATNAIIWKWKSK
jgi:glucose-specific phosphotransferase system IIA component